MSTGFRVGSTDRYHHQQVATVRFANKVRAATVQEGEQKAHTLLTQLLNSTINLSVPPQMNRAASDFDIEATVSGFEQPFRLKKELLSSPTGLVWTLTNPNSKPEDPLYELEVMIDLFPQATPQETELYHRKGIDVPRIHGQRFSIMLLGKDLDYRAQHLPLPPPADTVEDYSTRDIGSHTHVANLGIVLFRKLFVQNGLISGTIRQSIHTPKIKPARPIPAEPQKPAVRVITHEKTNPKEEPLNEIIEELKHSPSTALVPIEKK